MARKGSPSRLRFPSGDVSDEPLSKSAFARFIKCDPSRITQMLQAGILTPPALTPGGLIVPRLAVAQLDAAGAFSDREAAEPPVTPRPGETFDQARTRLASEQADAQAMKNAAARGSLIEIEKVGARMEEDYNRVRTRFLAVPAEHAPRLFRAKTVLELQDALYAVMCEVLQELSDPTAFAPRPSP